MAKIEFEAGDRFQCEIEGKKGHGLVLADGSAFIILGGGDRSKYEKRKWEKMPGDGSVLPITEHTWAYEITFALDCVAYLHNLPLPRVKS